VEMTPQGDDLFLERVAFSLQCCFKIAVLL
jgi:hypothetical protein